VDSKKVFISGTSSDLFQYRNVAESVIKELNDEFGGRFILEPMSMDNQPLDGVAEPADTRSWAWIAEADWVVLIVGWNYGTWASTTKNGKAISITEGEYLTAMEDSPPKKCFVFLAGENSDIPTVQYHACPHEAYNLANYTHFDIASKDLKAWEAVKRFRTMLREKGAHLFPNIDKFKLALKKELREAVVATSQIGNGRQRIMFSELILNLTRLQVSFIKEVKVLANLKQIHDRLHRIRQFGIRRWREVVVVKWTDENMSLESREIYLYGLSTIRKILGELEVLAAQIPPLHKSLQENLKNKVNDFAIEINSIEYTLLHPPTKKKEEFEDFLVLFASRVQTAFSQCNQAMLSSAENLRAHRDAIESQLKPVKCTAGFTDKARTTLNMVHEELTAQHDALQSLIKNHNLWQQEHDRLEVLDESLGSSLFKSYFIALVDRLEEIRKTLVKSAIEHAEKIPQGANWQRCTRVLQGHLEKISSTAYQEYAGRTDDYLAMRKAFDDLFFEVDVETLRSIADSELQVDAHASALIQINAITSD